MSLPPDRLWWVFVLQYAVCLLLSTGLSCSHCIGLADRTRLYQQMCEVWHAQQLWDGRTSAVIMLTMPNVVVEWHSSVFEKTKGQTLPRFLAIFPGRCRWMSRWSVQQLKLVHDCFLHILSDSIFMVFAWREWGKILKILIHLVSHRASNQAPCKYNRQVNLMCGWPCIVIQCG